MPRGEQWVCKRSGRLRGEPAAGPRSGPKPGGRRSEVRRGRSPKHGRGSGASVAQRSPPVAGKLFGSEAGSLQSKSNTSWAAAVGHQAPNKRTTIGRFTTCSGSSRAHCSARMCDCRFSRVRRIWGRSSSRQSPPAAPEAAPMDWPQLLPLKPGLLLSVRRLNAKIRLVKVDFVMQSAPVGSDWGQS